MIGDSIDRRGRGSVTCWRSAAPALLVVTLLGTTPCTLTPVLAQETEAAPVDSVVADDAPSDTLFAVADRARSMLDTLRATGDSVGVLRAARLSDPEADLEFQRVLVVEQFAQMQRTLETLADLMNRASPDSLPADSIRTYLRGYIGDHLDLIDRSVESIARDYEQLRRERSTATAQEIGPLESQIRDARVWADTLIRYQELALTASDALQLGMEDRWESFEHRLHNFAETTTGRLQLAAAEKDELEEQIDVAERTESPESEISGLRLRLAALETRMEATAGNMSTVSEALERRGFETSAYQETLIRTTGEVTGEVLDWQVLVRLSRSFAADTWRFLRHNAGTVFVRLLIVVFFILLFRITFGLLWRLVQAVRLVRGSRLVRDLVGRTLRPVASLIGLIAGLTFIGVQTTTLLAGLGVAGLVVGFALQDSISNLFAGFAILASRPYDVDDVVEVAGVVGRVRAMGLWNTTIVKFDARRLIIPNRNIWGSNIENRSAEVNRRVEAVARIGFDTDLQAAIGVLEQLLRDDPRVLEDPAPRVWVTDLDESWVEVKLWGWVKTEDWWSLYSNLRRLVRLKLAEEGIEVPVPRRDLTTRAAGPPGKMPPAGDQADLG